MGRKQRHLSAADSLDAYRALRTLLHHEEAVMTLLEADMAAPAGAWDDLQGLAGFLGSIGMREGITSERDEDFEHRTGEPALYMLDDRGRLRPATKTVLLKAARQISTSEGKADA